MLRWRSLACPAEHWVVLAGMRRVPSLMWKMIRFLCVAWILPLILSLVVYFGFSTNWTVDVFSRAGFEVQYSGGIYKYRLIGTFIQARLVDVLERIGFEGGAPKNLKIMDPAGSPVFYTAYFVNNTLFICLACSVFYYLFHARYSLQPPLLIDALVFLVGLLMAISQYVVVPYDMLSYFLLAVAIHLVTGQQTLPRVGLLGLVVVLAALARETAALIIPFYAAVHYRQIFAKPLFGRHQVILCGLAACFLCTYGALRLAFGGDRALYHAIWLGCNLTMPFNVMGLIFMAAVLTVLLTDELARQECLIFTLGALPYLVAVTIVGITWEIRLWVPVILCLIALKAGSRRWAENRRAA